MFQAVHKASANTLKKMKNSLLREQEVDQSHWGVVSACGQMTMWNRNLYTWLFCKLPGSTICL